MIGSEEMVEIPRGLRYSRYTTAVSSKAESLLPFYSTTCDSLNKIFL
jgi:hypothetical protein